MSRRLLAIVRIGVLMCFVGCGETRTGPSADQNQAGFVKLFNGKDLTGRKTSGDAEWVVREMNSGQ